MTLIDVRAKDGSRHFAALPEAITWECLRNHIATHRDATITEYRTDHVTEVWIDFAFRGHNMTVNNQFGEFWFFVADPNCPDSILADIVSHCEKVLVR